MLLGHGEATRSRHVFGDILERLPSGMYDELLTVQAEIAEEYQRGGRECKSWVESLGKKQMKMYETIFERWGDKVFENSMCYCYACERDCATFSDATAAYRVNVSGTPCIHWSSMGTKAGWGGASALCFMAWSWSGGQGRKR